MKKLFYIQDSFENRITYYHLLAFLIMLPFDRFYSTIILASFAIHSLLFFCGDKMKQLTGKIFVLQSVFFATAIGAVWSVSSAGWDLTERQLAIFLFPLLIAVSSLDIGKYRRALLFCFSFCCTATVAYLFIDAAHIIIHNNLSWRTFTSPAFLNHHFSQPVNIHATYLSLYIVIAICVFLEALILSSGFWKRFCLFVCLFILSAGMLQLGSRAACIALLLIVVIGFPFFLFTGKRRIIFLSAALSVCALSAFIINSSDVLRTRFVVELKDDFGGRSSNIKNDTRLQRWKASYGLIAASPLVGFGSGSETPMLKDIYFNRKMYSSYLNEMNVHNQYLSFLINTGIIGLLVYLLTLFWGFRCSFKQKDLLFFCFLTSVSVVSFSENFLDVNKGIFYYGFFFSFFIFSHTERVVKPPVQATLKV